MQLRLLLVLLMVGFVSSGVAVAQVSGNHFDWEFLGVAGLDPIEDVTVSGNYAYCITFLGIQIADISDPYAPRYAGTCSLNREAQKVASQGNLLFVSYANKTLEIFDISAPLSPVLKSSLQIPKAGAHGSLMKPAGNLLYVLATSVYIIDISEPGAATIVAEWSEEYWNGASDIELGDHYAYVLESGLRVRQLWLNDPSAPYAPPAHYLSGSVADIASAGQFLYTASSELRVAELQPSVYGDSTFNVVASYAGGCDGLLLVKNLLYVSSTGANKPLQIYDVSAAPSLALVASWDSLGYLAKEMRVQGDLGFARAQGSYGNLLVVFDLSDPTHPQKISTLRSPVPDINDMTVYKHHAYIADDSGQLVVFDLAAAGGPQRIASLPLPTFPYQTYAFGMARAGDYLYVCTVHRVEIYSLANPDLPVLVNTYSCWGAAHLAAGGNRLYIAGWNSSYCFIETLDISDPANPVSLGMYSNGINCGTVARKAMVVQDSLLYVATQYQMQMINLANPSQPNVLWSLPTYRDPDWVLIRQIALVGKYAYLINSNGGYRAMIYDVSVPTAPVYVRTVPLVGGDDPHVIGNLLFVQGGAPANIHIYDISQPAAPTHIGEYHMGTGYTPGFEVTGDTVVVFGFFTNIYLASFGGCCEGEVGNVDAFGITDLSDLSMLIAYLTNPSKPELPCWPEANVNGTGIVDLADLSTLIAYLTGSPAPTLPSCQ